MLRVVSSIKEHITTTEFWRASSFVLKRLESIAKYLTKLPLPFTFILYFLHLIRAALRIFNYFHKTKNKNLGDTFKLLFAFFKVSIAVIALILMGCGVFSLPSILLTSFFAYSIFKLIHSSVVLLVSTISYLKLDRNSIEQQWRRAQYRENMNKHTSIMGTGLLFVLLTCLLNAGTSILLWSNPLLLLMDIMICTLLMAASFYLGYKFVKNKCVNGNLFLKAEDIVAIAKFLGLFSLGIMALIVAVATPGLGISAITYALILLCAQDSVLTIYYYFYSVDIPDPEPANLREDQFNAAISQERRDYYHTFSPVLYLQTPVSETLPQAEEAIKRNKKLLLKATFVKLVELENKLEKISKLNTINKFFSQQKKLNIKKEHLLYELAWTLNTHNMEVLIDLFIQAIIDFPENKRTTILEINLFELLELLELLRIETEHYFIDCYHPQLNKNFLAQLFFMAKQEDFSKQAESEKVKPNAFYQSFWKKKSHCVGLLEGFQASRRIEQDVNLSMSRFGT